MTNITIDRTELLHVCSTCPHNTLCPPCVGGKAAEIGWRWVTFARHPDGSATIHSVGAIGEERP